MSLYFRRIEKLPYPQLGLEKLSQAVSALPQTDQIRVLERLLETSEVKALCKAAGVEDFSPEEMASSLVKSGQATRALDLFTKGIRGTGKWIKRLGGEATPGSFRDELADYFLRHADDYSRITGGRGGVAGHSLEFIANHPGVAPLTLGFPVGLLAMSGSGY